MIYPLLLFDNLPSGNSDPIDSTSVAIRMMWKAITIGTPSCRFLDVSHISVAPPVTIAKSGGAVNAGQLIQ